MTLLEQVRLCAKAMELDVVDFPSSPRVWLTPKQFEPEPSLYWPITNDAQAMDLAKKFMLSVNFFEGYVSLGYGTTRLYRSFSDESINHAIVECVAKLQKDKT